MALKLALGLLMTLVTVGLLLFLWSGSRGLMKPTKMIGPRTVESMESAGVLVYRRLRNEIKENALVILEARRGYSPQEPFWKGFFKAAYVDDLKNARVLLLADGAQPSFRIEGYEYMSLPSESAANVIRSMVHTDGSDPTTLSNPQLFLLGEAPLGLATVEEGPLSKRLLAHSQNAIKNFITISLLSLGNKDQRGGALKSGSHSKLPHWRAVATRFERRLTKENLPSNKIFLGLERWGQHDYLVFLP